MRGLLLSLFGWRRQEAALGVAEAREAAETHQEQRDALVLDAARAAVAQEFQIAERLDAKARNQVAVGGGWYALVQAAASVAISQYLDSGGSTSLFALVVALAALSAAALGASTFFSYRVWKLRNEEEINADSLALMAKAARDSNVDVFAQFVAHYRHILWTRQRNNYGRAAAFTRAVPLWIVALLAGLLELVLALALLAVS